MTYLTLIAFLEDPYNYSHWRLWFKVWIWRGHITSLQKNLWIYVYFVLYFLNHQFSPVQSLSHVQLFANPWIAAHQASLSITNSQSLPNSCPSSRWCHPTISSSVVPFSSHLQSLPASGSFPVSQFFVSDDQSPRLSASASVLPKDIQDWFPLGWTGWISLLSEGLSRVFSNTTVQNYQFWGSEFFIVRFSHPYMTTEKNSFY